MASGPAGVAMIPVLAEVLGRCLADEGSVQCHHKRLQLSASVSRSAGESRFEELTAWPRGRFEPAWMGGERGWQAFVTNGERAQAWRWWVVDGMVLEASVVGPMPEVLEHADRWLDAVRFGELGPVSAPRIDPGGPPSPPHSSPAGLR